MRCIIYYDDIIVYWRRCFFYNWLNTLNCVWRWIIVYDYNRYISHIFCNKKPQKYFFLPLVFKINDKKSQIIISVFKSKCIMCLLKSKFLFFWLKHEGWMFISCINNKMRTTAWMGIDKAVSNAVVYWFMSIIITK